MYKDLPNLQPATVAWQSLVYCADIVSWVIILLKPFFFLLFAFAFYFVHLENMPRHCVDIPGPPWDTLPSSDGNAARVVLAISFLSPGSLHWAMGGVTVRSAHHAPSPPVHLWKGPEFRILGATQKLFLLGGGMRRCWHHERIMDAKLPCKLTPQTWCPWLTLKAELERMHEKQINDSGYLFPLRVLKPTIVFGFLDQR